VSREIAVVEAGKIRGAGIVDPDIDAAPVANGIVSKPLKVRFDGHVGHHDVRLATASSTECRRLLECTHAPGREHHSTTLTGKLERGSPSDATARAGDDDDFPPQRIGALTSTVHSKHFGICKEHRACQGGTRRATPAATHANPGAPIAVSDDAIYRRPLDYDLEHEGDDRDVAFYCELARRLQPHDVLELACGSGRLTLPLAAAPDLPADMTIIGVELSDEMLRLARQKADAAGPRTASRVAFESGDMRTWDSSGRFDLVLIGCSSIAHLLTLEDRLAVWRRVHQLLSPGGWFVVDVTMPDIRMFAASLETPPRALLEIDVDRFDADRQERLVRSRTTVYDAYEQRAQIRFLYDKFRKGQPVDRYISDFESYVYFPSELRLLFLHTGFVVRDVHGDYRFRPPRTGVRELVMMAQAETK
jgi:SAM-dependent methyltransferase